MGGLKLENGCKVIHVPSYLTGLYRVCESMSINTIQWKQMKVIADESANSSESFDTIIISAGAGIFIENLISGLPVTLVRGQSVELNIDKGQIIHPLEAVLCGKYVSPLAVDGKMLVGATHEFKAKPLTRDEVAKDLFQRSSDLAPHIWKSGSVDKTTSGWRVQSERGSSGRIPIIGRLADKHDKWIFTGLGSRGLIHHGIYGKVLAKAVLDNDDTILTKTIPQSDWWKKRTLNE